MDASVERRDWMADPNTLGLASLITGLIFILTPPLSEALDWLWILMLVGFALLIFVVRGLHAYQAPADGALGRWAAQLVTFGAAVVLVLGLVFAVWELMGTPPEEDPGPIGILWMIGFFSFVIGIVLFAAAAIRANVLPRPAAVLMLVALIAALAVDMATGAFFEDEEGGTTEWGFFVGVPLFGLAFAWIGYWLRARRGASDSATPVGT